MANDHLILNELTTYTHEQIVAVLEFCLEEAYSRSDNIRTAAMCCPFVMTPQEWIKACAEFGIKEGTARNRLSQIRREQRACGEI